MYVMPYVSDVDLRKWEKVIDLRNGHQFVNLKKGHRFEVQMSDVEIGREFEDWMTIRGWTSIWVLQIYKLSHVVVQWCLVYCYIICGLISYGFVCHVMIFLVIGNSYMFPLLALSDIFSYQRNDHDTENYRSAWRQAHHDITDKNNNVSFECLDINYH